MSRTEQLLYTSFIAPDFEDAELPRIVRRARTNNPRLDVTGVLVFDGICFCGYLEGPPDKLDRLVATLRADSRHIELIVQERMPLAARRFPGCPLAFAKCDDADALGRVRNANPEVTGSAIASLERLLPMLKVERGP